MPMELYSSEAFVRDIANAISESEGKPLNLGGNHHEGIERDYAFRLISETKKAIEGNVGHPAKQTRRSAASRTAALVAKIRQQHAATEPPAARAARAKKDTGRTAPRTIANGKAHSAGG